MRRVPWRGIHTACALHSAGYYQVTVDGQQYLSHRVIWKMVTGEEPEEIDHWDTNKRNNLLGNLRPANRLRNSRNKGLTKQNRSGLKGASFCKKRLVWRANIKFQGKQVHLGYFPDKETAHAAYVKAAMDFHGEFHNTGDGNNGA